VCTYHAQKNTRNPWQQKQWVIPPQANAAFVCAMEDVLEVYTRPSDPRRPQVCVDESRQQRVAATRAPSPATPGQPERVDDEYERKGTANLFMVCEPLAGQRRVKVTERRTAVALAHLRREVSDEQYPQAEKMVLVMDNRNTHQLASLDEACTPVEARRLIARFDLHSPPKHGSWLNMAATALSVLATPCLDRRIPDPTTLTQEVAAWERQRNTAKCRVNWRFTTPDARIKLQRLYPAIQLG
jgi:hypothetical protein